MQNQIDPTVETTRHLHPLSLAFEIARIVRGNIVPTIAAVISARNGGWVGTSIAIAIIVLGIGIALIRYFTYRYQIRDGELVIDQGLIDRIHRTIPLAKIQNIDIAQNIFHRVLRVCEVRVETASGKEPEATMRVLSVSEFKRLRNDCLNRAKPTLIVRPTLNVQDLAGTNEHNASTIEPAIEEPVLLLALPTRLIAFAGILSNRGEVVAGIVIGVLWQMRFGESGPLGWTSKSNQSANKEVAQTLAADGDWLKQMLRTIRDQLGVVGTIAFFCGRIAHVDWHSSCILRHLVCTSLLWLSARTAQPFAQHQMRLVHTSVSHGSNWTSAIG